MNRIPADDVCLPDLLREQARQRPSEIAVRSGTATLTFQELAEAASRLAAHLNRMGVTADDCVGIFVEPSIELMVGVWGILFSGAAYLPLSPEYPEERLRFMVTHRDCPVVLAQEDLAERAEELAPAGTRIVTPRDVRVGPAGPDTGPRPDSIAYTIYTSGSTGKPKGVLIEQRSIVSQMRWLAAEHGLGPGRVVLQKTPLSFDAAQWEVLAPACGATVVMGTPGIYRDPARLIDSIATHGVTTLQCVPTLLQALLDDDDIDRCGSLTQVFSGGEALSRGLALQCLDTLPGAQLVNLYGPTECTINSSSAVVDRDTIGDELTISIGRPVHDTYYYVLDENLERVADGELGELYVAGIQLARGYFGRPDLTAERFVENPFRTETGHTRLYRTGDLVHRNADGTVQFAGRVDNQVKLRGFRVELDEIRLAIETHDWVRHAAVIVKDDAETGFQNLVACIELDAREAALMDQGNQSAHHRSKSSKLQVKAQLSNAGVRTDTDLAGRPTVDLPGAYPAARQRRQAFRRKTYRFYEGGDLLQDDLLQMLGRRIKGGAPCAPGDIGLQRLGNVLRYFGQHHSADRLLPKYGYASPGSLYATQLYVDVKGVDSITDGCYYYHPAKHRLVQVAQRAGAPWAPDEKGVRVHFVGHRQAIEPVYKSNIVEVLEIETGHMVGLFEEVLPAFGLDIAPLDHTPGVAAQLGCADDDHYLGTFEFVTYAGPTVDEVDIYVQVHQGRVADMQPGQYRYSGGRLTRFADDVVLRKQVIAINQAVYDRAAVGITVVSRNETDWLHYVDLGSTLQHLSMNGVNIGFMPSGYSSRSGEDLPAARRFNGLLAAGGEQPGPTYFAVGGRITDGQIESEGMKEDAVHMKGPAELIRDDLVDLLPDYMVPNKVVVLQNLPQTANGKIDVKALAALPVTDADRSDRPFVAPRSTTERRICELWKKAMKRDRVSISDDFFETGGNSLIAVALVNRINKEFESTLPLQVIFEAPTVEALAERLDSANSAAISRLIPLASEGSRDPVFCWPGLGGYPMNLRTLAGEVQLDRPFYGVQAHGINAGEEPYGSFAEMAAADVEAIRRVQPQGPYTLWGYSFGARVAFEAAYQLEQAGEKVANLFLLAPGSPKVPSEAGDAHAPDPGYGYESPEYVTILFSVFFGSITDPRLSACKRAAVDDESFTAFVRQELPQLDEDLVRRIVSIVSLTYRFKHTFAELGEREIAAPVTVFPAFGDGNSFIDSAAGHAAALPTYIEIDADHYSLLREEGVGELVAAVRRAAIDTEEPVMPHVSIKHFPAPLTPDLQSELCSAVTAAITRAFGCPENVVSIALEPIESNRWNDQVYLPEIVGRQDLLLKTPQY